MAIMFGEEPDLPVSSESMLATSEANLRGSSFHALLPSAQLPPSRKARKADKAGVEAAGTAAGHTSQPSYAVSADAHTSGAGGAAAPLLAPTGHAHNTPLQRGRAPGAPSFVASFVSSFMSPFVPSPREAAAEGHGAAAGGARPTSRLGGHRQQQRPLMLSFVGRSSTLGQPPQGASALLRSNNTSRRIVAHNLSRADSSLSLHSQDDADGGGGSGVSGAAEAKHAHGRPRHRLAGDRCGHVPIPPLASISGCRGCLEETIIYTVAPSSPANARAHTHAHTCT